MIDYLSLMAVVFINWFCINGSLDIEVNNNKKLHPSQGGREGWGQTDDEILITIYKTN